MVKGFVTAVLTVTMMSLAGCGSAPGPRYQEVSSFSDGLAAVKAGNGRWGFINRSHIMVIPAKFEEVKDFKDGKAAAKANGRWGFINKRGEWQ